MINIADKEKSVLEVEVKSLIDDKKCLESEREELQNRRSELSQEISVLKSEYKQNVKRLNKIDESLDKAVLDGDSTTELYQKQDQIKNRQKDIKRLLELKKKAVLQLKIKIIDLLKPIWEKEREIKMRKMYIFRKDFYLLKEKYLEEEKKHNRLAREYKEADNRLLGLWGNKKAEKKDLENRLSNIDSYSIEKELSKINEQFDINNISA